MRKLAGLKPKIEAGEWAVKLTSTRDLVLFPFHSALYLFIKFISMCVELLHDVGQLQSIP